jgi:hypothetical protein
MPKFKNLNQRQEVFAQGIAAGLSGVEAFQRVTSGNPKDCDVKADKMRRQPAVAARIQELMAQNSQASKLSREEALRWLSDLIRTPIGSVGKDSALVQAYEEDRAGNVKVRLADKIAAMQTLCRMTGWNEPDQVSLSGTDTLSAYLLELRAQPISGPILPLERHQLSLENGENVLGGR